MSDDLRRRRRLTPSGPHRAGGGNNFNPWLVTIFAAIVVIVGGWFLGQALAHWLSPGEKQVAQAPTPVPVITPLASPTESAAATAAPSPTAEPTSAPTPTPQPLATLAPMAVPTAAPTIAPTRAPTAAPKIVRTAAPMVAPTEKPRTTLPVARRPETAAPASTEENPATTTVRSYIDALRRGDPQAAAVYLGNGVPDEDFIDSNTRISSVNSTRNNDGSYKVAVDMQTSKGEYYETFIVAPTDSGSRILGKTAIKP